MPITGTFGCCRLQIGECADSGDRAVFLQHGAVGDFVPAMAIQRARDHARGCGSVMRAWSPWLHRRPAACASCSETHVNPGCASGGGTPFRADKAMRCPAEPSDHWPHHHLPFRRPPIPALEGETIAAALSAAGIVAFRHTASGAPRGLHCGMGACFDCVVTRGRPHRPARLHDQGGRRHGRHAATATHATGAARRANRRTRRPRSGRATCWWSAPDPPGCRRPSPRPRPGHRVVVLDERSATGGQYAKPLADSHADTAPDAQFRLGVRTARRALAAGARIETEARSGAALRADEIAALVGGRAVTFRPRRLMLATGAHERPVPMPGWTLPGVMTTGALQTLVRAQRVCPGERVLIAGSGPLNLQLACELLAGRREAAWRWWRRRRGLAPLPGARPGQWRAPRPT